MDDQLRYRLRAQARRLSRLRWVSKAREVRRHSNPSGGLVDVLRFVLWSPELGNYSHDVSNLDDLALLLAETFRVPRERARELLDEPLHDEQLQHDYAMCRRPALVPRRLSIGHRSLWWAVARLRRPRLVVETGVWHGLGALLLLRALERNEQDGSPPGRLLSFDPDPTSGWLVPERYRERWTWVRGLTEDALESNLVDREVDLFVHDTPSSYDGERFEFQVALAQAAPGAVLLSNNGTNTDALADICRERGLPYRHSLVLPTRHWYVSNGVSLAIVPGTGPNSREPKSPRHTPDRRNADR